MSKIEKSNITNMDITYLIELGFKNNQINKGEVLKNTDILLYAVLYYDCGKSLIVSNKKHGIV